MGWVLILISCQEAGARGEVTLCVGLEVWDGCGREADIKNIIQTSSDNV